MRTYRWDDEEYDRDEIRECLSAYLKDEDIEEYINKVEKPVIVCGLEYSAGRVVRLIDHDLYLEFLDELIESLLDDLDTYCECGIEGLISYVEDD